MPNEAVKQVKEPLVGHVHATDEVTVTALALYEAVRDELGLHEPGIGVERLDYLALQCVGRVLRDWAKPA